MDGNQPTHGDYDIDSVARIAELREAIADMYNSDNPVETLADLLMNGHTGSKGYLAFGNNKISKNTGIFNMNAATDCPNADSDEENPSDIGVCQVPWDECYAHVGEVVFPDNLAKHRRQEFLWDCVSPELMAAALLRVKARKRNDFEYVRVSETGDFRHNGDIRAWETIAEIVSPELKVYTYSASHKLGAWDTVEHMTVNQSNNLADYGDRLFRAVPTADDIPDGDIFCPFEAAKKNGVETDERPKCGECTACIDKDQTRNVSITIH